MARDDPQENSVPALWEAARYLLRWLVAMCGAPCALVGEGRLSPQERREIAFWLRPVEAIVRRLLVVEAARIAEKLPPKGKRPPKAPQCRPTRAPFCRVAFPDPEESSGWSVRFSLFERPPSRPSAATNRFVPRVRDLGHDADVLAPARLELSAAQQRLASGSQDNADCPPAQGLAARPKPSRAAGNPWPLAKRIEAVRRVLKNPAPYARRLARRLRKDAGPIARACRPPSRPPGERPPYGDEPLRHASEHAARALEQLSAMRANVEWVECDETHQAGCGSSP